jgi:hypothetical protein
MNNFDIDDIDGLGIDEAAIDLELFDVEPSDIEFTLDLDDLGGLEELDGDTPPAAKPKYLITTPRKVNRCHANMVHVRHADDFLNAVQLPKNGEVVTCVVSGFFVFGDLIEKLADKLGYINEITISTLSMSDENVDMFARMVENDQLGHINMLVSSYFYAHERNNTFARLLNSIHPEDLDVGVASVHTKIICIDSEAGKFVLSGSANLRTSRNFEQFDIAHSEQLHDFHASWMVKLIDRYAIIKKPLRDNLQWAIIKGE